MFQIHLHIIMKNLSGKSYFLPPPQETLVPFFNKPQECPSTPGHPLPVQKVVFGQRKTSLTTEGMGSGLKCRTREFGLGFGRGKTTSPGPSVYTEKEIFLQKKKERKKKRCEDVQIHSGALPCGPWCVSVSLWFTGSERAIATLL